ncbi:hypothetical protein ACN28S_10135 [Cystobacter fuscus]
MPSYGRYYGYDLTWRRLRPPPPPPGVQDVTTPPAALDLRVDTGVVREGYSVGLGLQVDGQRFGFGTRLDLFNRPRRTAAWAVTPSPCSRSGRASCWSTMSG